MRRALQREPGYLRRAANGHLMTRTARHGVAARRVEDLELPSEVKGDIPDNALTRSADPQIATPPR